MNTFGRHLRLTTFGESHGPGVGCVIDGVPPGIEFDEAMLRTALSRRRPGQPGTTPRSESDEPEVLSGLFEGMTTGTPIALFVRNQDQRSKDYDDLKTLYRPSHADYTYTKKYGHRDHRGGGRSSARETLARVAGGAVARMMLEKETKINVKAAVTSLGEIDFAGDLSEHSSEKIYSSQVRMPDVDLEKKFIELLRSTQEKGDSVGGVVSVVALDLPVGLGEPIYGKMNATLASGMMSINGATGFEMGDGFGASRRFGSENNDPWVKGEEGDLRTSTNHAGGVSGGISNGMDLRFRVGFKPPSSIARRQSHGRVDGETVDHVIEGRHDPSIVVRAVSVVEGMTWLVLADLYLAARLNAVVKS